MRHSCPSSVRCLFAFARSVKLFFIHGCVVFFGSYRSTIMPKDIQLYVTYIVLDASFTCAHTCVPCSEPGEFEESALDCACLVNNCKLM